MGFFSKIKRAVKRAFRSVSKTLRKWRNSVKKTIKNPLRLPEKIFKETIREPLKKITKEALRGIGRITRETFSIGYRITGWKFLDRIGDGFYILNAGLIKGDLKSITAIGAMVAAVFLTIVTFGAGSALIGAAAAYAVSIAGAIGLGVSIASTLHNIGLAYQSAIYAQANLDIEIASIGINTLAQRGDWLAGGVLRKEVMAGGKVFNPNGLIDANAQAFSYAQGDLDTTLLNTLRLPYEENAGGVAYNSVWAGDKDWSYKGILKKYHTPLDLQERMQESYDILYS